MAPKRIMTVGRDLPGDEFEYIPFDSDRTLLDADVVIFWPMFGEWSPGHSFSGELSTYQGTSVMGETSSATVPQRLAHWKAELSAAADAGKLVIVYLQKPEEVYRDSGRREWSGTGRNARKTVMVEPIATYSALPGSISGTARSGSAVQLTPAAGIIGSYWKDFGTLSPYVATIDGQCGTVLLQTPGVARTVGSIVRKSKGGAILFLPPVSFDEEKFTRYDKSGTNAYWNAEGSKFGKRLLAAVVGIAKALAADATLTPPPSWASDPAFVLAEEAAIQVELDGVANRMRALVAKEKRLLEAKQSAGNLRNLLYEQGQPLEVATREALQLMGFVAEGFAADGSEFDVLFTGPEGRCLGEVEGKDNRAINIDKLSQLERNIQEDFARNEVLVHAKGVLFGNAHRLVAPADRGEFFTEKCVTGAKRGRIALVRTPDLFVIARYLKEQGDSVFAAKCREVIFAAEGEVVRFPDVPIVTPSAETRRSAH